ncbi:MAG: hypothetical protein JSR21_01090 [Proteobacteria bacterium]|nr:hypothetical protein [Pseudomonadota bacterium]
MLRAARFVTATAAVLTLGLLAPLPARAEADPVPPPSCPATIPMTSTAEPLDAVAAAVRAGRVGVLAIGSAATVGQDGKANGVSFPYHMIEALRAALPHVAFDLTVKGRRGLTALEMLPMLDAELAAQRFALVLWQTGTVEAVHAARLDSLHATLDAGVQHIRARGGDTVLIDPPFSRALRANTDVEPYEQVMRQVAALPGVLLFQRYALTRSWVESGTLDVEKAKPDDRLAAVDLLHECVGRALAAFVLQNLHLPPP